MKTADVDILIVPGWQDSGPDHWQSRWERSLKTAKHGAAFAELNLEFFNKGVSGNTVLNLEQRWQKDTLDLKPDVLSILIGVNDLGKNIPVDQYEKVYDSLLTAAKAAS